MTWMRAIYIALRRGQWECGWSKFDGAPWAGVHSVYYDGQWVLWHVGPLWVSVRY